MPESPGQAEGAERQPPARTAVAGTRDRGRPPSAIAISTAHQIATVAPAVSSREYPPFETASPTYRTATTTAITASTAERPAPLPCHNLRLACGITVFCRGPGGVGSGTPGVTRGGWPSLRLASR